MDYNNENSFASQLRPPSQIPTPGKLFEMSAAATNARSTMLPPPNNDRKRKTLAERAGEPSRPTPAPPSSRPVNPHVRATSLAGVARETSFSSSVSSRPSSVASTRNTSGSSYSSSIGPGSRPPTSHSYRPQSAMSYQRFQRPVSSLNRPATSLEAHEEEPGTARNLGKRKVIAWDTDSRLEEVENMCSQFKEKMDGATTESKSLREMMGIYKIRITELEAIRTQLTSSNAALQLELDGTKARLAASSNELDDAKRYQNIRLDDMQRQHRRELEDARHDAESDQRRLIREHTERLTELQRTLESALEDQRNRHQKEIQALSLEGTTTQQEKEKEIEKQLRAYQALEDDLRNCKSDVVKEQDLNNELRAKVSRLTNNIADLETSVQRLEGHIHFLESDNKSQSHAFADLEARMQNALRSAAEANDKLRTEETLRRKLHNQVQELKGNIRVFCRVRPSLEGDAVDTARITYPDDETDSKEVEVMGPEEKSSLGNNTTKKYPFAFDRVFGPRSKNQDVFEEISQLVQSALDGYNVCIFCYGQTGSGKTYTMSASDGMIPLAVNQIYDTAKSLEEKGWKYKMEGSFIEVYNEVLNDLLGKADEFDKKKHEIKHDLQKGKTIITDITTVDLDSSGKVDSILQRASSNRSVASTKANERSSRSHSVFILKLIGENSLTGEKSEGTLNLVDLAGSERLAHSGATGERLKETQSINKSLSCLGDVIAALGQGKEGGHIPYRNSKLTYLLQNSLGGNSKTLMFVMISPLQAHLSETLTSLKFATKVHNTHIGTAKKQTKA
ncbi:hypothetical protein JMJ35_006112 [Cladonia borealis]|uniref:Kinesin-like protein n=1 Tax=Cladonia borealis TaxID=184061 RepID=A0AA39R0D1_9LECA|nr:hypothetical protein JMJ35_006112 [Cladonia borealis]